jgi:hypothetical protein
MVGAAPSLSLIPLPAAASTQAFTVDVTSLLENLKTLRIKQPLAPEPPTSVSVPTLALDDEPSAGSADGGNGAEVTRLLGIYTGQIKARIDRIWRRPRTPIDERASADARSFQCQVQIEQDATGHVQEILLPRCNGSPAWQQSLVTAIRQASPLPAPPSEQVFTHSLVMEFIGVEYGAGSRDDEYEIPVPTSARTSL